MSSWKDETNLNSSSIGIEIVNRGAVSGLDGPAWQPFPLAQIDALIVLVKDIVQRHRIEPRNILGHSEIAPQRKPDPGPAFPWVELAKHGLAWTPDPVQLALLRRRYDGALPDVLWFQQKLALHGYQIPQHGELDAATRKVLRVFQMRYRPDLIDGTPDAESAALLALITTPEAH